MKVYMFHSCKFHAPVMSLFFHPYKPFDDICPYFLSPTYPTDKESDSDIWLMPMVSLDSDSSEPSYLSYHVEFDPSEPSYPSVIRLTSDSSSSSAAPRHVASPVRGRGFICPRAVPHGCGHGRGEGRGDAPGGFGNGYLSFDG